MCHLYLANDRSCRARGCESICEARMALSRQPAAGRCRAFRRRSDFCSRCGSDRPRLYFPNCATCDCGPNNHCCHRSMHDRRSVHRKRPTLAKGRQAIFLRCDCFNLSWKSAIRCCPGKRKAPAEVSLVVPSLRYLSGNTFSCGRTIRCVGWVGSPLFLDVIEHQGKRVWEGSHARKALRRN